MKKIQIMKGQQSLEIFNFGGFVLRISDPVYQDRPLYAVLVIIYIAHRRIDIGFF